MKQAKLNIGSRKSGDKFAVSCTFGEPETLLEVDALGNTEAFTVACFNRGYRIRLQEQSGAREYVSNLSAKERADVPAVTRATAEIVAKYIADPNKVSRQSHAAKPTEVVVDSAALKMSKADREALAATLAAQGITLTLK